MEAILCAFVAFWLFEVLSDRTSRAVMAALEAIHFAKRGEGNFDLKEERGDFFFLRALLVAFEVLRGLSAALLLFAASRQIIAGSGMPAAAMQVGAAAALLLAARDARAALERTECSCEEHAK